MDDRQTTMVYTPVFISNQHNAEKHGIRYRPSLQNTLVYKEMPYILLTYAKGHVFYTKDNVGVAPRIETYNVYFKDNKVNDDTIFAESPQAAILLLENLYDVSLIESLEREHIERSIIWYNGDSVN